MVKLALLDRHVQLRFLLGDLHLNLRLLNFHVNLRRTSWLFCPHLLGRLRLVTLDFFQRLHRIIYGFFGKLQDLLGLTDKPLQGRVARRELNRLANVLIECLQYRQHLLRVSLPRVDALQ